MPLYLVLFCSLLGAGLVALVAPLLLARDFEPWELGAVAVVLGILLLAWRQRRSRRQREQVEELRDSALW